jgi:hypothetical protein
VENPAETSAPDPERADEMLVLRCPPCHRQASDTFFLSLLHSTRNGQIEPDKKINTDRSLHHRLGTKRVAPSEPLDPEPTRAD